MRKSGDLDSAVKHRYPHCPLLDRRLSHLLRLITDRCQLACLGFVLWLMCPQLWTHQPPESDNRYVHSCQYHSFFIKHVCDLRQARTEFA
jgi:hypothetical protein